MQFLSYFVDSSMGRKRKPVDGEGDGVAGGAAKRVRKNKRKVDDESDEGFVEGCDAKRHAQRNRASPCQIVRLYEFINDKQADVITDMELDSLLGIKCGVLNNLVINWLVGTYDRHSREFVIPGRGRIPLNERSI